MQIAPGHNAETLREYNLPVIEHVNFSREVTSDQVTRNRGGGKATVQPESIDYDLAVEMLDYMGMSIDVPCVKCTVVLPDWHRIPTLWNGYVTLSATTTEVDWWTNFRFEFTGLARA